MDSDLLALQKANNASQCGQDALTSSYGWLIQGILAVLVFTLLVGKDTFSLRNTETCKIYYNWLI